MRPGVRLTLGLALLVVLGAGLLALPGCGRLSARQAFFTSVSALTTTGLSVITPATDLTPLGQFVLALLMQVGGVGFMVMAVTLFRLLGRHVTLPERVALRDSLGLISAESLLDLTRSLLRGVLAVELAGAVLLWILWAPRYGPWTGAGYAAFHSISAFCNASFDLFARPEAPLAFPSDPGSLLVLSLLIILGSLGLPVIADLKTWLRTRRRLSLHTRLTLLTVAGLLVGGTGLLYAGWSESTGEPWPRRLLLAWFHSTAARTSGFAVVSPDQMSGANALTLMVLMFVGASPASVGGGVTTSTLAVLVLAMLAFGQGRRAVTFQGRTIPLETVTKAFALLTASLAFVGAIAWLLVLTQPASLSEALFEAISAFSTCGFSLGLTARLDGFGQFLLGLAMFCGRLGMLTLLIILTRESREVLAYPEEKLLLG